jgi:hypothetical protein
MAPRLVNPTPHKPVIYPAIKLPPVVNIPKGIDPGLASYAGNWVTV